MSDWLKGGLAARPQTKKTQAIQQRIDNLYVRYENKDMTPDELLEGLSFVVAKNSKSKKKWTVIDLCIMTFRLYVRYNLLHLSLSK